MRTDRLARNDLSPQAMKWYLDYLAVIDARDIDGYAGFLAEDCEMYLNNDGPVSGRAAIVGMLGDYWQSFAGVEHDLLTILGDDRAFVLEALNHYLRHDGGTATVRAVAFTDRGSDGLARSVRVYSDTAPVFAEGAS